MNPVTKSSRRRAAAAWRSWTSSSPSRTDTVAEHGYAEMRNIPGDQHAALRKQVRSAVRQRTGHGLQSLVHESMIIFICEPISQQHAAERARAAAEAINSVLTGEATPMPTPWRLSWDTWATS